MSLVLRRMSTRVSEEMVIEMLNKSSRKRLSTRKIRYHNHGSHSIGSYAPKFNAF
jgi:hypothetical protein